MTDRRAAAARLAWLAAALLAWCACAHAAPPSASAKDVEAAYLVNFLRYTQWPEESFGDAGAPFVIAVTGSDETFASIRAVAQAAGNVNGRAIVVRRARPGARGTGTSGESDAAHLAFFDGAVAGSAPAELARLAGHATLTVGDAPGFIAAGGMIELETAGDHVVFAANPAAIAAARLVVSAKVLKLARNEAGAP